MSERTYFDGIDVKQGNTTLTSVDVKDSEAREQLSDLEDYVETLLDVELMSRADWNALTTAQKQAKGLVAIADTTTGYERGDLVNGADYSPLNKYIPNTAETHIICEAYPDILDTSSNLWGNGQRPVNFTGDASISDDAVYIPVYTNGICGFVDLGASDTPFGAYIVAKASNGRILSATNARTTGNAVLITNTTIVFSVWSDDTNTGISAADYFAGYIDFDGTDAHCYLYDSANDNVVSFTKTPTHTGRYLTLGRTDLKPDSQFADPANLYVRYLGVLNDVDSSTDIEANLRNLYSEFISS